MQKDLKDELGMLLNDEVRHHSVCNKGIYEFSQLLGQQDTHLMKHEFEVSGRRCYNEYGCASFIECNKCVLIHEKCFQLVHGYVLQNERGNGSNYLVKALANNASNYACVWVIFSDVFRVGIMKSEENQTFDRGKYWFYFFGGLGPPIEF